MLTVELDDYCAPWFRGRAHADGQPSAALSSWSWFLSADDCARRSKPLCALSEPRCFAAADWIRAAASLSIGWCLLMLRLIPRHAVARTPASVVASADGGNLVGVYIHGHLSVAAPEVVNLEGDPWRRQPGCRLDPAARAGRDRFPQDAAEILDGDDDVAFAQCLPSVSGLERLSLASDTRRIHVRPGD